MTTEQKTKGKSPGSVVAFQAWLDILERFDALILEIRHSQSNIIHSLRSPILHRALRFEEAYLWGSAPKDLSKHFAAAGPSGQEAPTREDQGADQETGPDSSPKRPVVDDWLQLVTHTPFQPAALTKNWIVKFPDARSPGYHDKKKRDEDMVDKEEEDTVLLHFFDHTAKNDIERAIEGQVHEIWKRGDWSSDQKRHYYNLVALQTLKANILKDKLLLMRWGIHAFFGEEYKRTLPYFADKKTRISRFLLVRTAALKRANTYVERLGDIQFEFEKTLDSGVQDHPRPSLGRRREQGFYTSFLSDRTRDLAREIDMYLDSLRSNCKPQFDRTQIMHRWSHDYTSRSFSYIDELPNEDSRKNRRKMYGFIRTSYWMPDRPDLQSIIAHEVAHIAIAHRYNQLSEDRLSQCDDSFIRLIRLLNHCLETYGLTDDPTIPGSVRTHYTIKEIACDLLATVTQGHAYLFAMFQELIGAGLERIFDVPGEYYELELADHLESGLAFGEDAPEWYYRIHLVCTWLSEIHHYESSQHSLDTLLVEGVRECTNNLLDYLDRVSRQKRSEIEFWKNLSGSLTALIKNSDAAMEAKRWRGQRSSDFAGRRGHRGPMLFPNFTHRLPEKARHLLFKRLLEAKQLPGYPLCGVPADELEKKFDEKYLDGRKYDTANESEASTRFFRPLYQHLYDVPWQTGLLRAMDFHKSYVGNPSEISMAHIHCHSAIGRGLYMIALEFYHHNSPYFFLMNGLRLIEDCITQNSNSRTVDPERFSKILAHVSPDNISNQRQSAEKLLAKLVRIDATYKDLVSTSREARNHLREKLKRLGRSHEWPANVLLVAYSIPAEHFGKREDPTYTRAGDLERIRRLTEKMMRYKIQALLEVIEEVCAANALPKELKSSLHTVHGYLSIPGTRRPTPKSRRNYYQTIIDALSSGINQENDAFSSVYMLSRISVAGSYGQSDEKPNIGSTEDSRYKPPCIVDALRGLPSSTSVLGHYQWEEHFGVCSKIEGHGKRSYASIIGRYDIFSEMATRPTCRCSLPYFEFANDRTGGDTTYFVEKENFPSFFVRREYALPIRLDLSSPIPLDQPIAAVLAITLTHKISRLDFLFRLLSSINPEPASPHDQEPDPLVEGHLSPLKDLFIHDGECLDRAYLPEGWADLVIVFGGDKNDVERLHNIFKIQNIFFEDFQTDNTELILTPQFIPAAMRSDDFKVWTQVRIMEDRTLQLDNESFIRDVEKNYSSVADSDAPLSKMCDIYRTPGRTDFTIFYKDTFFEKAPDDFDHLNLFRETNIDVLQTNIGIKSGR